MSTLPPTALPPFEQLVFLTEARAYHKSPADQGRELALVGRSNTGKSSLVNTITRNRKMAITSRLPGRTRGLVFFGWPETELRLVDLPGYGFARTNAATKKIWYTEVNRYMQQRQSLTAVLLLMDCRRQLKDTEVDVIHWCQEQDLQLLICLTKADKLSTSKQQQAIHTLHKHPVVASNPPEILLCSTYKPETIEQVRQRIRGFLCPTD